MKKSICIIYLISLIIMFSSSVNGQTIRLFTGTYTESGEKGFYLFDLNRAEGTFKLVSASDAGPNPSSFCISKKYGMIYAANEEMKFKGGKGGGLTTLKYDPLKGVAEKISDLLVPNGGPCFISLSLAENYLFVANYSGGSIAVIKLDNKGIPVSVTDTIIYKREGGKVSHAHMIATDPEGKRVYMTDLGLDRIVIYNLDAASGMLHQIKDGIAKLPAGSGPRHFVFSSDGSKMYVICELNSTISFFNVDKDGGLKLVQTVSTLREGFKGKSYCADIHLGKNGDFLYGSNRGENTIVTFKIGSDGKLTLVGRTTCGGNWPRNFVIDPSGKYLLVGNEKSGNIVIFGINEKTGLPIEPGKEYKIKAPACLKF
jgi:6-phosphogluconolactonase